MFCFYADVDVNHIQDTNFIHGTTRGSKRLVFSGSMDANSGYDAFILDLIGIILKSISEVCGVRLCTVFTSYRKRTSGGLL